MGGKVVKSKSICLKALKISQGWKARCFFPVLDINSFEISKEVNIWFVLNLLYRPA